MTTSCIEGSVGCALWAMLPVLLVSCGGNADGDVRHAPASVQKGPPGADYWVERTDSDLDLVIRSACAESLQDGRPILLQFSASWCVDCRAVKGMAHEQTVKAEMDQWHEVVVNVGNFDRHRILQNAFGVSGIAHWVALKPVSCEGSPARWPRLKEGMLEPKSDRDGPKSPADIVAWLEEARS